MHGQAVDRARVRLDRRHAIRPAEGNRFQGRPDDSRRRRPIIAFVEGKPARDDDDDDDDDVAEWESATQRDLFLRALAARFAIFQEQHLAPRLACHAVLRIAVRVTIFTRTQGRPCSPLPSRDYYTRINVHIIPEITSELT